MNKLVLILIFLILFSACAHTVQTTSGDSYLGKHKNLNSTESKSLTSLNIEQKVRQIAAVEPTLKFPARIGIARIESGQLSTLPGEEVESWIKLGEKLGVEYGKFIPVNPMIAQMVSEGEAVSNESSLKNVIAKIRMGAARQHLDVVLIYEIFSKLDQKSNLLSLADITVLGGFILPSHALEIEGYSNAMLVDVINGYPYGTVETSLQKEESYSSTWGIDNTEKELNKSIKSQVTKKLVGEVEEMLKEVRLQLAESRLKRKEK